MLVYLDESYDGNHSFFLLGALFVPSSRKLHRAFRQAKVDEGYVLPGGEVKEIKYTEIRTPRLLRVAQVGVDLFMNNDAWFRCIVVDQRPESGWRLDYFGSRDERKAIKEARFYKKFAEMLLRSNSQDIINGVLLTDRMTRCAGDDFLRLIRDEFSAPSGPSSPAPTYRSVQSVDTGAEGYHLGQIGDLLTGAVLNELVEPKGSTGRYKRRFRDYVKTCIKIPSLGPEYWRMSKDQANVQHPKFQVWHWRPTS